MKPIVEMGRAELAAYIQGHLEQYGIQVVLSGGACVSIYTGNKYVSMNLDLVDLYSARVSELERAMEEIGFRRPGHHRKYFEHQGHLEEFRRIRARLEP